MTIQIPISASHIAGEADHVAVLLGLFNGEKYLGEQLASLEDQHHSNWRLLVSDDGSEDESLRVVTEFKRRNPHRPIRVMKGPQSGWAANFLKLLRAVGPTTPFAAFCDQDDVWMPDKLTRALLDLSALPKGTPGLYCGRTIVADQFLTRRKSSPAFRRLPCFANALVQCIAGGNTMVVNRAALDILQSASEHAKSVVSHDWWTYQVITAMGGHVIFDAEPSVIYRQHSANQIGANSGAQASFRRLRKAIRGQYADWNRSNLKALEPLRCSMTMQSRATFDSFAAARRVSLPSRLSALRKSRVFRQTLRGNISLWLATALKKI